MRTGPDVVVIGAGVVGLSIALQLSQRGASVTVLDRVGIGADIGDADLDSDSDRNGTGERGAAGRDSTEAVDETLTEHDGDGVESIDESGSEREANDIESDDRPDQDVEASETVEQRRRLNGSIRPRKR
jgi:glycine/D-amino acid oxidase-like deaminating enzyme